jgi:hypothetical protein
MCNATGSVYFLEYTDVTEVLFTAHDQRSLLCLGSLLHQYDPRSFSRSSAPSVPSEPILARGIVLQLVPSPCRLPTPIGDGISIKGEEFID